MKISIITCTYNSDNTIEKCIDSVFAQGFKDEDFEHIFVDAYSTDNTRKIIEKKYKWKNNFHIIQSAPKGVYNAMNIWILKSKWPYLYLLNSDDFIYQKWLSSLLEIALINNYDFCFWNVRFVNTWYELIGKLKPSYLFPFGIRKELYKIYLLAFHYCCPQSTIYKKTIHDNVWVFTEKYKLLSDREFSIKVSEKNYCTKYEDIDISCFLRHDWSLTSNPKHIQLMYQEWREIINKYFWYRLWDFRVWLVKTIRNCIELVKGK